MKIRWIVVMAIGFGLSLAACESTPIPTTDSAASSTIVSPQATPTPVS